MIGIAGGLFGSYLNSLGIEENFVYYILGMVVAGLGAIVAVLDSH